MDVGTNLFIKSQYLDRDHYQVYVLDENDNSLVDQIVPITSASDPLEKMFQTLSEKGLVIKTIYVPIWLSTTLSEIISRVYPGAEVLLDYNEN